MAAKRLLRLWGLYATMDLLYLFRGPQVALMYYFSDTVVGISAVTATFLLAQRFDGIGPWNRPQVLLLLGYTLCVRGLIDVFFNFNLAFISRRIGRGQLDHILIQPQPVWMILLTEGFAPVTGSGMLLPAVALLIYSMRQLDFPLSASWFGLFVVYLVSSIAIVLSFEYAWGSIAFWAPRGAEEINSNTWRILTQLSPFPLDGLTGLALTCLVTVVPVGLIAWYPSRVLLGMEAPSWSVAVPPVAGAVALGLTSWIFTRGLHHYAETGSSRYLAYGHRR